MLSLKCIFLLFAILGLSHCLKKCGTKNKNARIFNGQDASRNQFPWHVLIVVGFPGKPLEIKPGEYNPSKTQIQRGGGVWISKKHILTCAHTLYPYDRLPRAKVFKGYANVGVTDTSKNVSKANQLKFTDSDVIFYPDNKNPAHDDALKEEVKYPNPEDNHKLTFFHYDIALIKITIDNPGNEICPICLPGPKILHSIKNVKLSDEITIVGLGKRNKMDTDVLKRKLQYAKMNRITEKQCWQDWYPKKSQPKDFSKIENQGLCVKGSKKDEWSNRTEVVACAGDSGSPAFWKHKNKKEYLIGIALEVHAENDCELGPKKTVKASKYVAVPGVIFKWIKEKGGKEIEDWIKKC